MKRDKTEIWWTVFQIIYFGILCYPIFHYLFKLNILGSIAMSFLVSAYFAIDTVWDKYLFSRIEQLEKQIKEKK